MAEHMSYSALLRPSTPILKSSIQTNDHHSSSSNTGNAQSIFCLGKEVRATELLMQVMVNAESYKARIYDLAVAAAGELTQKACTAKPLWIFEEDRETETLNVPEYKRRFESLDSTLEEVIRLLSVGEPNELSSELSRNAKLLGKYGKEPDLMHLINGHQTAFKTEASRETEIVPMNPINIVDVLIDVEQWSLVFCDIVSEVSVLGFMSSGEELGNPNGALQVTREIYFARYCKQMTAANTWVVVDVSLESIFPDMVTQCRRKASGCLIQGLENGFSKVTWIEHNEIDYSSVPNMFRKLVSSGFAFQAKRWIATLRRQCERLKLVVEDDNDGRRSLLQLSQRISRSYNEAVRGSTESHWQPLPTTNGENILVKTSFNVDDPGHPHGVVITVATSLRLNIPPNDVFEFLCSGSNRSKWDLLSHDCATQDIAYFATGREPSSRVSLVVVEHLLNKTLKFYLQESYTDATGYYIVYAPVDDESLKALLKGGSSTDMAILGSGFTVLPENPVEQTTGTGGSILTIVFQIADENLSSPEYLPPELVATLHNLIAGTLSLIQGSV
ncbi:hypothetical protein DCAR_0623624 [Daucus carota subsp. sativus]|uniref:START domain-containing protein n=1 Tax=Daucus carota subsp. sativus TaxID=79200 RepID=A0AAF0XA13_DAUCS|nr:hypothetical protein DCAR_0623624 [Daucus carota subsp. sativus]